jgi:hypothetical protein
LTFIGISGTEKWIGRTQGLGCDRQEAPTPWNHKKQLHRNAVCASFLDHGSFAGRELSSMWHNSLVLELLEDMDEDSFVKVVNRYRIEVIFERSRLQQVPTQKARILDAGFR